MKLYIDQQDGDGIGGSSFALYREDGTVFPGIQAASIHHSGGNVSVLDLSLVVDGVNIFFGKPPCLEEHMPDDWLDRTYWSTSDGGFAYTVHMSPLDVILFLSRQAADKRYRLIFTSEDCQEGVSNKRLVDVWDDANSHWLRLGLADPYNDTSHDLVVDIEEGGNPLASLLQMPMSGALLKDGHIQIVPPPYRLRCSRCTRHVPACECRSESRKTGGI